MSILTISEMASLLEKATRQVSLTGVTVEEIHDSGNRESLGIVEEDFVLFAEVSTPFTGELPSEYRVLNALVSDYVAKNYKDIETLLFRPVLSFLNREYPDSDYTDLLGGMVDFVWEDQLDYTPMIDEENGRIRFSIELVLEMESREG